MFEQRLYIFNDPTIYIIECISGQ